MCSPPRTAVPGRLMAAPAPSGRSVWALPAAVPPCWPRHTPQCSSEVGGNRRCIFLHCTPVLLCCWPVQEGCTHRCCSPRADARVTSPQHSSPWTKASPASLVTCNGKRMVTSGSPALSVCLSVESLSFQVKAPSHTQCLHQSLPLLPRWGWSPAEQEERRGASLSALGSSL